MLSEDDKYSVFNLLNKRIIEYNRLLYIMTFNNFKNKYLLIITKNKIKNCYSDFLNFE